MSAIITKKCPFAYPVWAGPLEEALLETIEWAQQGSHCKVAVFLNPHSYITAKSDADFAVALGGADWVFPDGIGIVIGLRLLSWPVKERIPGPEFFTAFSRCLDAIGGLRIFFIGSTPNVLAKMVERFLSEHANTIICGWYSPPQSERVEPELIEQCLRRLAAARADIVFVGMTAPKQEILIQSMRARCDARIALGIGAAFDYYAGTKHRAPAAFRAVGLEWMFRLLVEPRRLWRRTFWSLPLFIIDLVLRRWS